MLKQKLAVSNKQETGSKAKQQHEFGLCADGAVAVQVGRRRKPSHKEGWQAYAAATAIIKGERHQDRWHLPMRAVHTPQQPVPVHGGWHASRSSLATIHSGTRAAGRRWQTARKPSHDGGTEPQVADMSGTRTAAESADGAQAVTTHTMGGTYAATQSLQSTPSSTVAAVSSGITATERQISRASTTNP